MIQVLTRIEMTREPEIHVDVEIETTVLVSGYKRWSVSEQCRNDPGEINHVIEEQQTMARTWLVLSIRGEGIS